MKKAPLVPAVILLITVAILMGCTTANEYTSKIFSPRTESPAAQEEVNVKFIDLEESSINKDNWVTTDIINGKDTLSNTWALDSFSKKYPATATTTIIKKDTLLNKPDTASSVAKSVIIVNGSRMKNKRDQ